MAYPTKTKYAQISNDDHEVVILPKENIWKHWALILCFLVGVFFGAAVAAASGAAAATKHENAKGQHIALLPESEFSLYNGVFRPCLVVDRAISTLRSGDECDSRVRSRLFILEHVVVRVGTALGANRLVQKRLENLVPPLTTAV